MSKLHIGIVGTGFIAEDHAKSLNLLRDVAGLSVFDTNAARAEAYAKKYNAALVPTLAKLIAGCDLVWICTPPFAHKAAVLQACKAGKAIFCEKPLAHNAADAKVIRDAVRKAGVPFFMGHSGRYTQAFVKMKQLVDKGAIGEPLHIWSTRLGFVDPKTCPPWRLTDARSGGLAVELGIHEVDFVRWLGGDVKSFSAVGHSKILNPGKYIDQIVGVALLRSGITARLDLSWANPRYLWQRGIDGTKASLMFDDSNFNQVLQLQPGKPAKIHTVKPDGWRDLKTDENVAFRDQAKDVINALTKGTPAPVTLDDGYAGALAAIALQKAAKTGKTQNA